MPDSSILDDILKELKLQKRSPFPVHVCAQAGVVTNYASSVMSEALEIKYSSDRTEEDLKGRLRRGLIQNAAASIRMLQHLNDK